MKGSKDIQLQILFKSGGEIYLIKISFNIYKILMII